MTDTAEIIAMALQVGVREYGPNTRNWSFDLSELESFVALVADKAAATEREACAQIAEGYIDQEWPGDELSVQAESTAGDIRARGQKEGAC